MLQILTSIPELLRNHLLFYFRWISRLRKLLKKKTIINYEFILFFLTFLIRSNCMCICIFNDKIKKKFSSEMNVWYFHNLQTFGNRFKKYSKVCFKVLLLCSFQKSFFFLSEEVVFESYWKNNRYTKNWFYFFWWHFL